MQITALLPVSCIIHQRCLSPPSRSSLSLLSLLFSYRNWKVSCPTSPHVLGAEARSAWEGNTRVRPETRQQRANLSCGAMSAGLPWDERKGRYPVIPLPGSCWNRGTTLSQRRWDRPPVSCTQLGNGDSIKPNQHITLRKGLVRDFVCPSHPSSAKHATSLNPADVIAGQRLHPSGYQPQH